MTLLEAAARYPFFRRAAWLNTASRCFFASRTTDPAQQTLRVRETINDTSNLDAPYLVLRREDLLAEDWEPWKEVE